MSGRTPSFSLYLSATDCITIKNTKKTDPMNSKREYASKV